MVYRGDQHLYSIYYVLGTSLSHLILSSWSNFQYFTDEENYGLRITPVALKDENQT